jgi:hypothetical protein
MIVIKPPEIILIRRDMTSVFLAGSIEMNLAEKWQDRIVNELKDSNFCFLNPRRDDWNDSWVQSIDNDEFRRQVEWELDGLERADLIVIYFDKDTKSPITLLELGLFKTKPMIVCCPEGFYRKGNVDIVCKRYDIKQVNSLEEIIQGLKILETL